MKITAQPQIIKAILESLTTNVSAQGISMRCKIVQTETTVEFIPLEKVTPQDWFWLGYFVREYVE
ncbi:hypothetical protein C4F49_02315 [Sphingobacterium sp. KB22]|uniref:Uncharacterized protein n=1 Tax=Sphingobacterium hungaricum TaxID=2082723 RepID=A0A928YP32_9SPHI|nr:hypothetical protein [Sphingobacterium hungaricum]